MKLLIDGDVMVYRAGFAAEKTKYLVTFGGNFEGVFDDAKSAKTHADKFAGSIDGVGVGVWSRKELEPEKKALEIVDIMIGDIRARYSATDSDVLMFLSGVGNFRHGIATRATYKGNRDGMARPKHFKAIREHLLNEYPSVLTAGEEADDAMGVYATAFPDSVICSIDKDLKTIPGKYYDFVKKEEYTLTPKDATLNFYLQVLTGDSADNVPGLKGVGPAKAKKILEGVANPMDAWARVIVAYNNEFGAAKGVQYAIEAARLVYIRKKPGEMWVSPGTTIETKETPPQRETTKGSSRRVSKRAGTRDSERSNEAGSQV